MAGKPTTIMSKPSLRKWEDITDLLTPKGVAEIQVGTHGRV